VYFSTKSQGMRFGPVPEGDAGASQFWGGVNANMLMCQSSATMSPFFALSHGTSRNFPLYFHPTSLAKWNQMVRKCPWKVGNCSWCENCQESLIDLSLKRKKHTNLCGSWEATLLWEHKLLWPIWGRTQFEHKTWNYENFSRLFIKKIFSKQAVKNESSPQFIII
jgi:hypothetical protein